MKTEIVEIAHYFENEMREYIMENFVTDTKWTKKEAVYYLGLSDKEARELTKDEAIEAAIEQQKNYYEYAASFDEVCSKFVELIQ